MNQVQFDEKVEEICQKINIKFFSTIETAIYRIVNSWSFIFIIILVKV